MSRGNRDRFVTNKRGSDRRLVNSLLDQVKENLSARKTEVALGDGAYDRREIFGHLQQKGIQPIIIRSMQIQRTVADHAVKSRAIITGVVEKNRASHDLVQLEFTTQKYS